MDKKKVIFYLAANSKDGFVSFFDEATAEDFSRDTYFVKSGAGCGKATAIQHFADALCDGNDCEYIHCSSDPASLDAIICKTPNVAFVDGTSPHVGEPRFPAARGDYITLSAYKDMAGIKESYPALMLLAAQSKDYYTQAYRLISAGALIDDYISGLVSPFISSDRLVMRARGIAGREIPQKGGVGRLKKRFIDGITPSGYLRHYETVTALADKVYDFNDNYGFAHIMLAELCALAIKSGYDVYACYCPKSPDKLKHLIIPELSLAFVTSDRLGSFGGTPYRRIRLDSYFGAPALRHVRANCKSLAHLSKELLDEAISSIHSAHACHDKMEEIYRPHVDFDALNIYIDKTIKRLKSIHK